MTSGGQSDFMENDKASVRRKMLQKRRIQRVLDLVLAFLGAVIIIWGIQIVGAIILVWSLNRFMESFRPLKIV